MFHVEQFETMKRIPTKLKLARRMMTKAEVKSRYCSPFQSLLWGFRKEARAKRVEKQRLAGVKRREARRKEKSKQHKLFMKKQKENSLLKSA